MNEIRLTQGKVALVDDEDFEYLNQFKWHACKWGKTYYAIRSYTLPNGKCTTTQMSRMILDTPKGMETDHIDHNGLNNQKYNLRICTKQENAMNNTPRNNCTSKFKGVYWYKQRGKWHVRINKSGKQFHLGYFNTEIEAAITYNKKAQELFGVFANLNNTQEA